MEISEELKELLNEKQCKLAINEESFENLYMWIFERDMFYSELIQLFKQANLPIGWFYEYTEKYLDINKKVEYTVNDSSFHSNCK